MTTQQTAPIFTPIALVHVYTTDAISDTGMCTRLLMLDNVQTMTIDVNAQAAPSFIPIAAICSGDALSLPTTSTNAISGSWSPAIDNTTTNMTYTFTPDGGQCATSQDLTVNVNAQTAPSFIPIAAICSGDAFEFTYFEYEFYFRIVVTRS